MWKRLLFFCSLGLSWSIDQVGAFSLVWSTSWAVDRTSSGSLAAVRQPRRNLKKRKGRERKSPADANPSFEGGDTDTSYEYKPLIASRQREAGEDFWIDPDDLRREQERQHAIANRIAMEGEMSKEKLMTEVVAPYKQNWIGLISVVVVVLAAIVTNFPEVLENPSISFPDLDAGDPIPMQSTLQRAVVEVSATTAN